MAGLSNFDASPINGFDEWIISVAAVVGHENLDEQGIVDATNGTLEVEIESDDAETETELMSHSAAIATVGTLLTWYRQQGAMTATTLQTLLSTREFITSQRVSSLKQKINDDFPVRDTFHEDR